MCPSLTSRLTFSACLLTPLVLWNRFRVYQSPHGLAAGQISLQPRPFFYTVCALFLLPVTPQVQQSPLPWTVWLGRMPLSSRSCSLRAAVSAPCLQPRLALVLCDSDDEALFQHPMLSCLPSTSHPWVRPSPALQACGRLGYGEYGFASSPPIAYSLEAKACSARWQLWPVPY
jgi:hypothetical protein